MKIAIVTLMFIMLCCNVVWAAPEDTGDDVSMQLLDHLSVDHVNQFITKMNSELQEDIPLLTPGSIKDVAGKGLGMNWQTLGQGFLSRLFRELAANMHLLGKLLFLAVLCALLQNLQNSFEHSAISLLAYSVCYIFLIILALNAFYNVVALASQTIGYMSDFMEAMLPVLISLLAGMGAVTSATLLTPLMLFVVNTVSVIVKEWVLPLLLLTAMMDCINNLTDKYKLSNLSSLCKQGGMFILGLTLVVFVGIISIQGVAGGVADGLGLRTAKYATATFVPVVGKMFSDTVELVMGASLLIKNAIGIIGVIAVVTICVFPLVKILSLIIVIKIAGALVQPLGDEKMAKCLDAMGNNLLLVFGGVMTVALMFFLVITIIIGSGSVAMMLR